MAIIRLKVQVERFADRINVTKTWNKVKHDTHSNHQILQELRGTTNANLKPRKNNQNCLIITFFNIIEYP